MPPNVKVPLNTMLADLDETLRALMKRELGKQGFDGVEIAFDAPDKEWSAALAAPMVNCFLYDLRESKDHRPLDWEPLKVDGEVVELRPPLRLDATYAVTAWTRAVEDEHRLLSQVLAILYAYPELPEDLLAGRLALGNGQRWPLHTKVANPNRDGGADFWTAVGGQYKASLDLTVTVSCEAGTWVERGPEVRTQTLRMMDPGGRAEVAEETHRLGGTVRDADGEPVQNAWVMLRAEDGPGGGWAATDARGRFVVDRLTPGAYRITARAPDGGEGSGGVSVPGGIVNLVVGEPAPAKPARRRKSG